MVTDVQGLTLVGDVIGDGHTQGSEATQSKLCDLAADLVPDLVGIVGVAEHDLQRIHSPDKDSRPPCNPSCETLCAQGRSAGQLCCPGVDTI